MNRTSWATAQCLVAVGSSDALAGSGGRGSRLRDRTVATAEGQLVVLNDGRVLQIGGFEGDVWGGAPISKDCEIYDPRQPQKGWVACAPMPEGRGMFWAATLPSGNVL